MELIWFQPFARLTTTTRDTLLLMKRGRGREKNEVNCTSTKFGIQHDHEKLSPTSFVKISIKTLYLQRFSRYWQKTDFGRDLASGRGVLPVMGVGLFDSANSSKELIWFQP